MKTFDPRQKVIPACATCVFIAACVLGNWRALNTAHAADKKSEKEHQIEYMFIQTAQSITVDGDELTLHGISPITVFFSDRPDRIAGHGATQEYVDNWTKGEDSFEAEAPNAALSILGDDKRETREVIVVLKSPRLKDGSLTHKVSVLDGELPAHGGISTLFIDVIGRPLTPLSYAGQGRRVARRTSRRVARRSTYGGW